MFRKWIYKINNVQKTTCEWFVKLISSGITLTAAFCPSQVNAGCTHGEIYSYNSKKSK